MAVIFSGTPESSRRILSGYAIEIAAFDHKGQAARMFRLAGVPSAVLIGPGGTIASETVVGLLAVKNLLAQHVKAQARWYLLRPLVPQTEFDVRNFERGMQ